MTTDFTLNNLLDCWEQDEFVVELYYDGFDDKRNRRRLAYRLYDGGKTIFEGTYFFPAPVRDRREFHEVMDLLGFLTIQPGDTDEEFFKDYTPEQLAWCKSARSEELRQIMYDFEDGRDPMEEEVM